MGERFRKQDWIEFCKHLDDAYVDLAAVRQDKNERRLLNRAIWACWTFMEYAVNVLLELNGEEPETSHDQSKRVQDLKAAGLLQTDFSQVCDQINEFRLKAFYGNYTAGSKSTHFSTANVQRCLDQMAALRAEVETQLQARGKLQ